MKKTNLLIAAAAAIVICSSAYAGVTVMADDSAVSSTTETTQAKDEVILSVEDLTAQNLTEYDAYSRNGYGIYSNQDNSSYTVVTNGGKEVSTINNSEGKYTSVSFATGCATNNVICARRADGTSTILNLDGSYYGKLTGNELAVIMEADVNINNSGYDKINAGGYFVNNEQNLTFFNKEGSELFKLEGTGTIIWKTIKNYYVLQGNVGGVSYNGAYDKNLNKIYNSISLSNDGYYRVDNGTDTIFFNKEDKELFRIPYTGYGNIISWAIFNGNNVLSVKDSRTYEIKYLGLYDNNLNLVMPTPENANYISVNNGMLQYVSYPTISSVSDTKYYCFDANLNPCEKAPSLSASYKLEDSFYPDRIVTIDGTCFVVGSKSEYIEKMYVRDESLFDTSGKLVYDGFEDIYSNGLCTIKDSATGKIKLVQLSVKTLENASKSGIDLDSNNVMTGEISVAVSTNSNDSVVSEPISIHIESPANVIPQGASLCAGTLKSTDGERFVLAQNAVADTASKFTVFDIDLLSAANIKVQPDGNVKIALGIPATYSTSSLKVYRIETDGTKTDMNAVVVGGKIVFETNHFSIYVLSDESAVVNSPVVDNAPIADSTNIVSDVATNVTTAPPTMDKTSAMLYVIISIVATGCLMTTLLFNKKKYNEE